LAQRDRVGELLVDIDARIDDGFAGDAVCVDAYAGLDRDAIVIELDARLGPQPEIGPREGRADFAAGRADVDLGLREVAAVDIDAATDVAPIEVAQQLAA